MDILIVILAAFAGFFAGVIVNVLADSMPYYRTPQVPTYANGSPRPVLEWSGLIAFLHRKTPRYSEHNDTKPRIRLRHPIVEIFMTLFFVFIVLNWPHHERILIWMIYLTILILITVIDIEHFLILFPIIIPSCLLAIAIAIFFPEDRRATVDYLIGGALGAGVFFAMFWGGGIFSSIVSSARGEQLDEVAFGFGDVLLATLCGLMIGWQSLIFAMLITVFAGAAGAILFLLGRMLVKGSYNLFTPLPYGPYIVLGTVILMLWRDDIRTLLGGS